jgi:hypothetical protein
MPPPPHERHPPQIEEVSADRRWDEGSRNDTSVSWRTCCTANTRRRKIPELYRIHTGSQPYPLHLGYTTSSTPLFLPPTPSSKPSSRRPSVGVSPACLPARQLEDFSFPLRARGTPDKHVTQCVDASVAHEVAARADGAGPAARDGRAPRQERRAAHVSERRARASGGALPTRVD